MFIVFGSNKLNENEGEQKRKNGESQNTGLDPCNGFGFSKTSEIEHQIVQKGNNGKDVNADFFADVLCHY